MIETKVIPIDRKKTAAYLNYSVKAALFICFFIAIVLQPAVVEGKAMGFRAPLFLASSIIVPLLYKFRGHKVYRHTGDALLAAPFLLDTLGNLLGFYNDYQVTDDILHLVNWVLLVAAYHAFRYHKVDNNRDAVLLGYGFGAIAIVWWEAMEWAVSQDGWGGAGALQLTYGDTIGDLVISSTGGLLGSVIGVIWLGARRKAAAVKP